METYSLIDRVYWLESGQDDILLSFVPPSTNGEFDPLCFPVSRTTHQHGKGQKFSIVPKDGHEVIRIGDAEYALDIRGDVMTWIPKTGAKRTFEKKLTL